ncbi:MAG TPA: BamA/TamA family outer membrane protein [Polyangiaceae bacterium]|nr:BamA/TamA family outer membrane protein [Polyangiaceae bacterium]
MRPSALHIPALALALPSLASLACTSVPQGRSAIDTVKVHGADGINADDVTDRLATTASPKFLGLMRGVVYDYSIYDESVLQRDLARVERYYRGKGFLDARARAARVTQLSANHVRVDITVDEGPPTLDRNVTLEGIAGLPAEDIKAVVAAADTALPRGARFDEDRYKKAQDSITRSLTDRGYAYATLKAEAKADLGAHAIDYVFTISPGIPAVFGSITFLGLDPDGGGPQPPFVDSKPLLRAIDIRSGKRYSATEIEAATQALLDLGVFSAVRIEPTLSDPPSPIVPLVVQVEPASLRSVRLGGGAEFDAIKTDVHALIGWEDRNFMGGLRDFNVELKPAVVLYPTRIGHYTAPTNLLPGERLRLQLRQPGFIEARTVGFVQPEFNVFPLLVETTPIAGAPVVGYVEPKASVGLNRHFGKHLYATLAYNVQAEFPFAYVPATNESQNILNDLRPLGLLFPQLTTTLDYRDNAIHPHQGFYLSNDFQVAGLPGTSIPSDVRVLPEARGYVPLAHGVTLAVRGKLGFLFGANYGDAFRADLNAVQNGKAGSVQSSPGLDSDIQTVYFRGFFSGGPSSNRGFALRNASPFGIVPFLSPATSTAQVNACTVIEGTTQTLNLANCLIPIGGFTLWEASVEVRFDIGGPFGVAVFCDTGDVSPNRFDLRFGYLHMSCGAGARYDTPVGPIRLDVGYRIQPLQVIGFRNETAVFEANPTYGNQPTILGIPIAVAFGIGEAF